MLPVNLDNRKRPARCWRSRDGPKPSFPQRSRISVTI